MLWELRMSDLQPLLNIQPQLKRDLLLDVMDILRRLAEQQPKERCWEDTLRTAEGRLAELDAPPPAIDMKPLEQAQQLHRRTANGAWQPDV